MNKKNEMMIKKRQQLEMTQGQLADLLGVKSNTVCQYENGNRKPRGQTAIKISKILNIPLEKII
ncbi:helix-turn-helix transcriptional regulator [Mycoplasmatota bacterium]|nr:helix-turn-helix transcriptional regulator [Mycoplasmatota bacterium]